MDVNSYFRTKLYNCLVGMQFDTFLFGDDSFYDNFTLPLPRGQS